MVMSNIPKSFQDYDDDDPAIHFRKNRWKYWNLLKLVRKEFMANRKQRILVKTVVMKIFFKWMLIAVCSFAQI